MFLLREEFRSVPKTLFSTDFFKDGTMSTLAQKVLYEALSKKSEDPDFRVVTSWLASLHKGRKNEGRDAVKKALSELRKLGYATMYRRKTVEWKFYDTPGHKVVEIWEEVPHPSRSNCTAENMKIYERKVAESTLAGTAASATREGGKERGKSSLQGNPVKGSHLKNKWFSSKNENCVKHDDSLRAKTVMAIKENVEKDLEKKQSAPSLRSGALRSAVRNRGRIEHKPVAKNEEEIEKFIEKEGMIELLHVRPKLPETLIRDNGMISRRGKMEPVWNWEETIRALFKKLCPDMGEIMRQRAESRRRYEAATRRANGEVITCGYAV